MEFEKLQDFTQVLREYAPETVFVTEKTFGWLMDRVMPSQRMITADFEPLVRLEGSKIRMAGWRNRTGILDLTGDKPVFRETPEKIGGTDPD